MKPMTPNTLKVLLNALLMLTLSACQQSQPNLKPQAAEPSLEWTQLQQMTLDQLKAREYGLAADNVQQMLQLAAYDHERWEYIRMALVTMPADIARPLIEAALEDPFVKQQPEQLYGFSRVYTQLKMHEPALELINRAIKKDRQEAFVYWRARLLLLLEKEQLAINDYQWLLQQDAGNEDYLGQYATLLNYLNKTDQGIDLLKQNETKPGLLYRQVVLLLQSGRDAEVDSKFHQLMEMTQTAQLTTEQLLEMGELAMWMEDYPASIRLLSQVNSGEQLDEARLLLGRVYMQMEDYDRAAVIFRQVQNGPESHAIPAYQYEIELNRRQDRIDDALALADRALRMFSDDADLLYSRAMLHEQLDELPAVERDLLHIISQQPDHADALNALGYTWAERGIKLDQAYEYIMRAHQLKPDNQAILDSVGWIYYQKGDLANAEKYLRMAIRDNQLDQETYQHLVTVLREQGKTSEAQKLEQQMLELFPGQ
jgi:tetratricopeptide (TPR) repeat protein